MSLTLIKHPTFLEILEGDLPFETPVKVYTEAEVKQMEAWAAWMSLTDEQRELMLMQSTSAQFKDWMDEDDWQECKVMERPQNPYMPEGAKGEDA